MAELHIFDTPEELTKAAFGLFLQAAAEALRAKEKCSVALSGGGTPLPLYQRLAQDPEADRLDWNRIHFFWGDERPVGPDHPDSNYQSAYQALLGPRGIPEEHIHRVQGEDDPARAARQYQQLLGTWFSERPPQFDLILLGMGDDGHTASIFPQTDLAAGAPGDESSWVEAVWVPKLESWRISFTPQLINAAARVVFLVSGGGKAETLREVIQGPYRPAIFPAQLIQPRNGKLTWLIDSAAAAELDP